MSRSDRTTNVHPLFHEPSLLPLCPEQDTSKPKVPDCTNDAIQELKKRIEQYKIANEALQKKALECGQQQQQNTLSQCASPKCNKSHFQPSSSRNSTNRSQNIPKPDCTPDCSVDLQELKHKCDFYKQANYTLQKQAMENKRKACQQRHAAKQPPANNLDYCNTPPCNRSNYQPISSRSMGTCCMSPMNAMQNQTPSQMISQNNYFQDSRSIPCASPGTTTKIVFRSNVRYTLSCLVSTNSIGLARSVVWHISPIIPERTPLPYLSIIMKHFSPAVVKAS